MKLTGNAIYGITVLGCLQAVNVLLPISLPLLRFPRFLFIKVVLVLVVLAFHALVSGLGLRTPEINASLEHALLFKLVFTCLNQGLNLFILPLRRTLVLSSPIGLLSH